MSETTAETDAFAAMTAAHPLSQLDEQDRRRNVRRGLAAAAVVLVHVLILLLIMVGNEVPFIKRIRETIPEAITWIPMQSLKPKQQEQPPPKTEIESYPAYTAPITLPPEPRPNAQQQGPGTLLDIGRSLACGASSYEYLSPQQRDACMRHPWAFKKKNDGTIVLDAPTKPVEPPPSIADIMRHEQQTAPPCPILNNTPCLGKVMHGDPLGGAPSPF